MGKATAIRMHPEYQQIDDVRGIDLIKIEEDEDPEFNGWKKKADVHDHLNEGYTISVDISPYPELKAVGAGNDRYVRSNANSNPKDNLLNLPGGPPKRK